MARKPRLHVPGGLYHVTLRGNHRQPVFELASDRDRLDSIIADAATRDRTTIHAYCWMTNHIHALVEVSDLPLGRFMQRVASRYARFLQRRLETSGHLFERRYHCVLVDTERYLLDLVRYIHLNPVRGGLVADPADYEWSSHRDYLGLAGRPWVYPRRALGMLARDLADARDDYRRFMADALGRSLSSPHAETSSGDRRVLGDREFLDRAHKLITPGPSLHETLEEIIGHTCAEYRQPVEAVMSAARTHRLSAVRAEIARRAVDGRIATLSDVARALGRSASAISQALDRARRRNEGPAGNPPPKTATT